MYFVYTVAHYPGSIPGFDMDYFKMIISFSILLPVQKQPHPVRSHADK